MSFLQPQFFWGLLALSIPILIHFFNFRRHKTVFFSNTAFLKKVERNTRSINKLKHWLILASRLAALAALVLAFTQPTLPLSSNIGKAPTYFSLYIDNSNSMGLKGANGPLLNQARSQAAQLISSLPSQAKIQVLSNNFSSASQRYYNKNEALRQIDQITIAPHFRAFADVLSRVEGAWQNQEKPDSAKLALFVFSDFQETAMASFNTQAWPTGWQVQLVPLSPANPPQNVAVDSVWFTKPLFKAGFEQEIKVRLRNYSKNPQNNLSLNLLINKEKAGLTSANVPALGRATVSLFFTPNTSRLYQGQLALSGPGPKFDNSFYFSFSTQAKPKVLMVDQALAAAGLNRFFPDSIFELSLQNFTNVAYNAISQQNLTLISASQPPNSGLISALQQSLANGNNIFIFPADNPAAYQAYLKALNPNLVATKITDTLQGKIINYQDPYFYQVFLTQSKNPSLPSVYQYFKLKGGNLQPLVSLENNQPLLAYFNYAQGDVFFSTTALQSAASNLARHPILAPVLVNAALYQGQPTVPYLRASSAQANQYYPITLTGDAVVALNLNQSRLIPPQQSNSNGLKVFVPPGLVAPGNYPLTLGDSLLGHFSVNLDIRESDLSYTSAQKLANQNATLKTEVIDTEAINTKTYGQLYSGFALWPYCLALALVFLMIEVILLKIWRK